MKVWTIGDLHLSFGVPDKGMEMFGDEWKNHPEKIATSWNENVSDDDLVLLPGDISWGMNMEEAMPDLEWIDRLPGKKILIRGNHDYWWGSKKKLRESLPSSLDAIVNDARRVGPFAIGGTRLWDTREYHYNDIVIFKENPKATTKEKDSVKEEKIFVRELERLETSLKSMDQDAPYKIVMVHYPPIGLDLAPSRTSKLLDKYGIDVCLFGHIHSIKPNTNLSFQVHKTKYYCTSADFLGFKLLQVADTRNLHL